MILPAMRTISTKPVSDTINMRAAADAIKAARTIKNIELNCNKIKKGLTFSLIVETSNFWGSLLVFYSFG